MLKESSHVHSKPTPMSPEMLKLRKMLPDLIKLTYKVTSSKGSGGGNAVNNCAAHGGP